MIPRNIRHLRVFLAVAQTGSATRAGERCLVSQSAVTQALGKLERETGGLLFSRGPNGFHLTRRGEVLARRTRRALVLLDEALGAVARRLISTATTSQLEALIAVAELQNYTLAARRLGLAQPTVHRAISQLEHEAARALFERTSFGIVANRQATNLAQAARIAFAELSQAEADLADFDGNERGHIVVGSLPLCRSIVLPQALIDFCTQRSTQVTVVDGVYSELLAGLRRGEIDMIVGALREPAPIDDVVEERLFDDSLSVLVGAGHPLLERSGLSLAHLGGYPWIVPRRGTPSRRQFDAAFAHVGPPSRILEVGSILLMREMLAGSQFIGCISSAQAAAEVRNGLIAPLHVDIEWPRRPIGITTRVNWEPTAAQQLLIDLLPKHAQML